MTVVRPLLVSLLLVPLLAAPVRAVDVGNHLVVGGAAGGDDSPRPGVGEAQSPMLTHGGFSLGTVVETTPPISTLGLPFASERGALAVGGDVAYGRGDMRLSSSLRSDGSAAKADISAAYSGILLGTGNIAALRLGAARTRPQEFSLNPQQPGMAYTDPYGSSGDLNLSLSLMHQVTPTLSVGGTAGASRPSWAESSSGSSPGFMLGAGMGYRF